MSVLALLLTALMPLVPQHGAAGSWDEVIAVFAAVVLTGIGIGVALWAKRLRPETEGEDWPNRPTRGQ